MADDSEEVKNPRSILPSMQAAIDLVRRTGETFAGATAEALRIAAHAHQRRSATTDADGDDHVLEKDRGHFRSSIQKSRDNEKDGHEPER